MRRALHKARCCALAAWHPYWRENLARTDGASRLLRADSPSRIRCDDLHEQAADVVEADLDLLADQLRDELATAVRTQRADRRRRRIPRLLPGAGAAPLEPDAPAEPPIRRHRARQLHPRRPGLADGARGRPEPAAAEARHHPAAARRTSAITQYLDSRRVDRVADLLPASTRSRRWTPTSTGCAISSTTACASSSAGKPVEGVLFYSSSEIYGDPTPENIPTPETYRGNVSCTGPRACYDESKRYGETLCVNFARQHGVPIKVARPFNNYGPGLKITDRRVIPDFARDILAGRDMVMLSDGSARRTFCYVADAVAGYYKILVKGRPGEAYNVGVETPEISMPQLAGKLVGSRARAVRLSRAGSSTRTARTRTTSSTTRTAAARSSPRRAPSSATTRRSRSTKAAAFADLVLGQQRGIGGVMKISIIGTGYVGLVTGACLADKGHQVTCVDVDPARVAALNAAESPIFEAGLDELLRRHVGRTAHGDDRSGRARFSSPT